MGRPAAIVTGASSGIGLAIAAMLGDEGYGVTLAARRPDKLAAAAEGLTARGHDVQHVSGDLGDEDAVRAVAQRHTERFGRLDVLVNNAGVGIGRRAEDVGAKDIDIQLNTNLRSLFLFHREAIGLLRETAASHGRGLIVNMSSMSGKEGEAGLGVYSATKHGVIGFTQAMNRELAGSGVRATALCPGFVDTPMTDFLKDRIPAESMIQVSDIAEAVRYLLRTSPGCVVPEIQFQQPEGSRLPA
jgi:ketoreductase